MVVEGEVDGLESVSWVSVGESGEGLKGGGGRCVENSYLEDLERSKRGRRRGVEVEEKVLQELEVEGDRLRVGRGERGCPKLDIALLVTWGGVCVVGFVKFPEEWEEDKPKPKPKPGSRYTVTEIPFRRSGRRQTETKTETDTSIG